MMKCRVSFSRFPLQLRFPSLFLFLTLAWSCVVFAEIPFTVKLEYVKSDGGACAQEVALKVPDRGPAFHEVRPETSPVTASIISQSTTQGAGQGQQALIMIQVKMKGRMINQILFPLSPGIPLAYSFSGYDTKGNYLLTVNNSSPSPLVALMGRPGAGNFDGRPAFS